MSRTFYEYDFDHWMDPIVCFKDIMFEMQDSAFCGPSGRLGLPVCITKVLDACIDAARQRFLEAIKEAGEEAKQ